MLKMDAKFAELLRNYANESVNTSPGNQELVALRWIHRAYALGKEAGRTEAERDRTATNYQWHSDNSENGGEPGLEQ